MTEATFLEEEKDPRMEAITVDELCQACGFIFVMKVCLVLKNLCYLLLFPGYKFYFVEQALVIHLNTSDFN